MPDTAGSDLFFSSARRDSHGEGRGFVQRKSEVVASNFQSAFALMQFTGLKRRPCLVFLQASFVADTASGFYRNCQSDLMKGQEASV